MRKRLLLFCNNKNKFSEFLTTTNIFSVIFLYRYTSLLLTSFAYLLGVPKSPVVFKLGVIVSLFFAANILTGLYKRYCKNSATLVTIIFIETIGITLLLIPTGGIGSTFIWYALNPVLVAASFLPSFVCWLNLSLYIICELAISFLIFNTSHSSIIDILNSNSQLILIYILITLAVQLMSGLTKELNRKSMELELKNHELTNMNTRLRATNNKVNESMEHIMSLYQIAEALTLQNGIENVLNIFADYTIKLTKSNYCFFWTEKYKYKEAFKNLNNTPAWCLEENSNLIIELWPSLKYNDEPSYIKLGEETYLIVVVKSITEHYGLIGINLKDNTSSSNELNKELTFISRLSGAVLERLQLEEIANKLTIVEEQNRIAGEIHDSVSQQLFGMVCLIHYLLSKWATLTDEDKMNNLNLLSESAGLSMSQLRNTIYQLSSTKKGERIFISTIREQLEVMSNLNNIKIELIANGDENTINVAVKKALYRILSEACGNAIRHGKCTEIMVKLILSSDFTQLNVIDNGNGFNIEKITKQENSGLGIYNMRRLVENFNGKFEIKNNPQGGIELDIFIPNIKILYDTGGQVAL